MAPVVQADRRDVAALKDAPEPGEGSAQAAAVNKEAERQLSKGHFTQSLDRRHRGEKASSLGIPLRTCWGYWFWWYSVWLDLDHLPHSEEDQCDLLGPDQFLPLT